MSLRPYKSMTILGETQFSESRFEVPVAIRIQSISE